MAGTTSPRRRPGRPRKVTAAPKPQAEPAQVADINKDAEMGPRDTPEAQEFAGWGDQVQNRPGDTVRDRRPEGTGMFTVGPATRDRYGIKDTETIAWPVDTRYGNLPNVVPQDNLAMLLDANPSARIVLDPKTRQPVRIGEHVMVAYPKALAEEHQRHVNDMAQATVTAAAEHGLPGDRHDQSEDDIRQWIEDNKEQLHTLGVGSEMYSDTAGVPYRQVLAALGREGIDEMQRRYRLGGRRPNAAFEEEERVASKRDRQEREPRGRRVWSGWRPD